jgi:hypothetical protein
MHAGCGLNAESTGIGDKYLQMLFPGGTRSGKRKNGVSVK